MHSSTSMVANPEATSTRPGIFQELEHISERLGKLSELLIVLEKKLTPVLLEEPPPDPETKTASEAKSPVITEIRNLSDRTEVMVRELTSIKERLDL